MGNSPGESVTLKVILAFLLPLIVFIVSLAIFGRVLARAINTEGLQISLSFLLALLVAFLCVFITRVLNKRLGSDN